MREFNPFYFSNKELKGNLMTAQTYWKINNSLIREDHSTYKINIKKKTHKKNPTQKKKTHWMTGSEARKLTVETIFTF